MHENKYIFSAEVKAKKRATVLALILFLLFLLVFILGIQTGTIHLPFKRVLPTLLNQGTGKESFLVFQLRMPRIIISVLVGAGLAVSGCILQSVTRNPMADPGILGINAGAGLVVLGYIAGYAKVSPSPTVMSLLSWVGSIGAALTIYLLARNGNKGLSSTRLLLTGIALNFGIQAITTIITLSLNPQEYQTYAFWMAGSLWGITWPYVVTLLPIVIASLIVVLSQASSLDILPLGESMAASLGVSVRKRQGIAILFAVMLAGSCVAAGGNIGFVGLLSTHISRRLVGAVHKRLLPVTAMVGGLLVLIADTIGRSMFLPSEMPTGIVVSVIGAPYFLYLLLRTAKREGS
jgi:iron complex transport system permease protein